MRIDSTIFALSMFYLRRTISHPGWLITVFILLVCLSPYAGSTPLFKGNPVQTIDPFSMSLLTPAQSSFSPVEMLYLAGLLLVTFNIAGWMRLGKRMTESNSGEVRVYPMGLAAIMLYSVFLVLTIPVLIKSSIIPGAAGLFLILIDSLIKVSSLIFFVLFVTVITRRHELSILFGVSGAVLFYLMSWMLDLFVIGNRTRELVSPDWSLIVFHVVILIITATFHLIPVYMKNNSEHAEN